MERFGVLALTVAIFASCSTANKKEMCVAERDADVESASRGLASYASDKRDRDAVRAVSHNQKVINKACSFSKTRTASMARQDIFLRAVWCGDYDRVQQMLKEGKVDIEQSTAEYHGASPLMLSLADLRGSSYAVNSPESYDRIADLLIERGANVEFVQAESGTSVLEVAAYSGNLKIVQQILKKNPGIQKTKALSVATSDSILEALLAAGADPNAAKIQVSEIGLYFTGPMIVGTVHYRDLVQTEMMLKYGAKVDAVTHIERMTALEKLFLEKGSFLPVRDSVRRQSDKGASVPQLAELLLSYGADINRVDQLGNSLLHRTIFEYCFDYDKVRFLLAYGAKADLKNAAGLSIAEIVKLNLDGVQSKADTISCHRDHIVKLHEILSGSI